MNSQSNMNQNDLHKKQPFSVPEGYFDSFPDKVLKQINDLPVQQEKTPRRLIIKRQLSIAAAFIGFFLVSYFVFNVIIEKPTISKETLAQSVSYDDVVLQHVNEQDILDVLTENETPINAQEVENYLIDENIHESVLSDYLNQ